MQVAANEIESVEARQNRVFADLAALRGRADFAVLPELWPVGAFNYDEIDAGGQGRDGSFVRGLVDATKAFGGWVYGGSFVEQQDEQRWNTSVLIRPDGEIERWYRKIHLFGFDEGEAVRMQAGTEIVSVPDTPLGHIGLAICYDLRFPELFREQVARGAETLVICSGWPVQRLYAWRALIVARAIENQAWVVACNGVGTHQGATLVGHSMVVDPKGQIVLEAGEGEETHIVEVDPLVVPPWRESFPALKDRRL